MKISKNPIIKNTWFIAGMISLGLGILGYILPVMPGTTFILISAYCFARSNEKWYKKLLKNKYFGQTIKDFQAGRGMSLKAKIMAITMIVVSISISLLFASNFYVQIFLILCLFFSIGCVLWQKTKKVI